MLCQWLPLAYLSSIPSMAFYGVFPDHTEEKEQGSEGSENWRHVRNGDMFYIAGAH